MAIAFDNLVEIVESEPQLLKVIEQRTAKLPTFKGLGPPDLCYIIKEEKGGVFSSAKRSGYYHYVYGADASTPLTIIKFLKETLQKGPTDLFAPKSPVHAIKAIYCLFDIIARNDIRIELSFPEKIEVYSVDETKRQFQMSELEWGRGLISSVLRSFHPQSVPAVRVLPELNTTAKLNDFLAAAGTLIKEKSLFEKTSDVLKSTQHYLIGKIMNYFLAKTRFDDCLHFLENLLKDNKAYLGYITKAYLEIGACKEAVLLSTIRIQENMGDPVLLHYQAKGLLQLHMNDYALTLAKYACELCPESTSAWTLLGRCYIAVGNYKHALLAIDTAPVYDNEVTADGLDKGIATPLLTKPKKHNSTEYYGKVMCSPLSLDFEITSYGLQLETKTINKREDEEQLGLFNQLGANKFSDSEREVYEVLALIEKSIGWDALINIRDQLFIKGEGNDWDNPKVAAECPKRDKKTERLEGNSLEVIRKNGQIENEPGKKEDSKGPAEAKMASPSKEEKKGEEEMVESKEIVDSAEVQSIKCPKEVREKRVSEKIDDLLTALNDDLYVYYYWEDEEASNSDKLTHKYRGKVWLYRGMVAERLNRKRMAERAYKRVNTKGFSIYAWSRLLDLYSWANNMRATFACIVEIMNYFAEEMGLTQYLALPGWVEGPLNKIIAKNGLKAVIQVAKEENVGQYKVIKEAFDAAVTNKVYGYNAI